MPGNRREKGTIAVRAGTGESERTAPRRNRPVAVPSVPRRSYPTSLTTTQQQQKLEELYIDEDEISSIESLNLRDNRLSRIDPLQSSSTEWPCSLRVVVVAVPL